MGNKSFQQEHGARVLFNLIASKWTIEIVKALQQHTLRFNEIQKALPNTTQKVLTEALRKLERCGVIQRAAYPTIPPQVDYKLTLLGQDLLELSKLLNEWAETHADEMERAQKAYDRRRKS